MTDSMTGPVFPDAIGASDTFLRLGEQLSRAARVNRPVLLLGERGTGKELAARKLHYLSSRWQGPLVTLNCAALAPSVIESELFGHEAGAFTGADKRRAGRFETAHEGTLFLDEIGLIPLPTQEKILRAVEYATFERVGSSRSMEVDVRIIGATNADLQAMAENGSFKRDLLDRLSFEVIVLPPLREREGDALLLARHFAARMAMELGRSEPPAFSPAAERQLRAYPWPGNVRELKNVIERSVYRCDGGVIDDLVLDPFAGCTLAGPRGSGDAAATGPVPPPTAPDAPWSPVTTDFTSAVREFEAGLLRRALRQARYNQRQAASGLGLTYHQFRGLYRKHRDLLETDEPA